MRLSPFSQAASMAFSTDLASGMLAGFRGRYPAALQRSDLAEAEQWWIRGGLSDLSGTITLEDYPYHIFEYLALTRLASC